MFPCSRHIHRLWQYADIVKAIKHRIFAQFQTIPPQSHIFQYINANAPPSCQPPPLPFQALNPCHSKPPFVTPSIHPVPPSPPSLSRQAPAPIIPQKRPLSFRAPLTPVIPSRPHSCHFEQFLLSFRAKREIKNPRPQHAQHSKDFTPPLPPPFTAISHFRRFAPTPGLPCHIPSVPLPRRASTPYHSKP